MILVLLTIGAVAGLLISEILWTIRLLIIMKHLPRLTEKATQSEDVGSISTIWWSFRGDKLITQIDSDLGRRLSTLSRVFYVLFSIGVTSLVALLIWWVHHHGG